VTSELLDRFVEAIGELNPFQAVALREFCGQQGQEYRQAANSFLARLLRFAESRQLSFEYLRDSYLGLCRQVMLEQAHFLSTGGYRLATAAEAEEKVYSSHEEMLPYMYGLALSRFLWPNHYALYRFYLAGLARIGEVKRVMEIGPGHGWNLLDTIEHFPGAEYTALELSPVSLELTTALLAFYAPETKIEFCQTDITGDDELSACDLLVMGEVLEHLDDPAAVLSRLAGGQAAGSAGFITTCVNAPAIDHIFLYTSVDQIRDQLRTAGWEIYKDLAVPATAVPEERWEAEKTTINYAAWLTVSEKGV